MQRVELRLDSGMGKHHLSLVGAKEILICNEPENALAKAEAFISEHQGSYIGCAFGYDLKNDIEHLESSHESFIPFPALILFVPEAVSHEPIHESAPTRSMSGTRMVRQRPKAEYVGQVHKLLQSIQKGDIYEVNFCQELGFEAVNESADILYERLLQRTDAPYSGHLRYGDLHLLCGSPELFLRRDGDIIRSCPIKGTRKRDEDPAEDERIRRELESDPKERAENIMITDLVRNDLSRVAMSQSVEVEELCGIYSFRTVHQMISTVRADLKEGTSIIELLRATFPMGSMTGAPKVSAMQHIEEHEDFRRGIYSGSIGYIHPNGDFRFNVVIRSILYDASNARASISAGGAITALSDPEAEYEESLLKARAMMEVIGYHPEPAS